MRCTARAQRSCGTAKTKQGAFQWLLNGRQHRRRLRQRRSVGEADLICCGDLLLAAENIRGETANRTVIVIGDAHRLTGLSQTGHIENLRQWLERIVADVLRSLVVKEAIERQHLAGGEVRFRRLRQRGGGPEELQRALRAQPLQVPAQCADDLLLPQLPREVVPLGADDVAVSRIGEGALAAEVMPALGEAIVEKIIVKTALAVDVDAADVVDQLLERGKVD